MPIRLHSLWHRLAPAGSSALALLAGIGLIGSVGGVWTLPPAWLLAASLLTVGGSLVALAFVWFAPAATSKPPPTPPTRLIAECVGLLDELERDG